MTTSPGRMERRLSGPSSYSYSAVSDVEDGLWRPIEKQTGEPGERRRSLLEQGGELVTALRSEYGLRKPLPTVTRCLYSLCVLLLGVYIGTNFPTYLTIYTRRPAGTLSLLPPDLPPLPSSSYLQHPPTPGLPQPEDPIPNILHYVYGMEEQTEDFPYFAYLAMRSAILTLRPERVMFHCVHEPRGYWWDRILSYEGRDADSGERKGRVEVIKARDVEWIGKDRRPVTHYAHKADILRLEVLLEHGGIYLDIDTFILRPFESHGLMNQDVVLAMEARPLELDLTLRGKGSDDGMDPKGLCNAVILARPGAEFLKRWVITYEEGYDSALWEWNSVKMPWILAKLYPTLLTVLSDRVFFWPIYTEDHIRAVYTSTEYDFEASGQLAYHAWESRARTRLTTLTPELVRTRDTSFTRMIRRWGFQDEHEERDWKAWLSEKEGMKSGSAVDHSGGAAAPPSTST